MSDERDPKEDLPYHGNKIKVTIGDPDKAKPKAPAKRSTAAKRSGAKSPARKTAAKK